MNLSNNDINKDIRRDFLVHKLGLRPRRKVKHWTPKGDCKVAGIKGRN